VIKKKIIGKVRAYNNIIHKAHLEYPALSHCFSLTNKSSYTVLKEEKQDIDSL